jgi:hypothetical protein
MPERYSANNQHITVFLSLLDCPVSMQWNVRLWMHLAAPLKGIGFAALIADKRKLHLEPKSSMDEANECDLYPDNDRAFAAFTSR